MKVKKDKLQVPHSFTYVQHHFDVIEKRIIYNILCRMDTGVNVQPELFSKNMTFSFNWKDLNAHFNVIADACDKLMDRKMTIKYDGDKQIFEKVVPFPYCKISNGVVSIVLMEQAIPYFLEIGKGYTTLGLKAALSLRSKYSQRFYEMLSGKIWHENGRAKNVNEWPHVSITKLRELLGVEHNQLKQKTQFEERVLKIAQAEISANTDIDFKYKYDEDTKIGKTYQTISFTIFPRQNGAEWEDLKMQIQDDISQTKDLDKMGIVINLMETKYQFNESEKAIISTDMKAINTFLRVHQEIASGGREVKTSPTAYMRGSLKEFLFS